MIMTNVDDFLLILTIGIINQAAVINLVLQTILKFLLMTRVLNIGLIILLFFEPFLKLKLILEPMLLFHLVDHGLVYIIGVVF